MTIGGQLTPSARDVRRAAWLTVVALSSQGVQPLHVHPEKASAARAPRASRPATHGYMVGRNRIPLTELQLGRAPRTAPQLDSARRSEIFARRVAAAADSVRTRSDVPVRLPLAFYAGPDDDSVYVVFTAAGRDRYAGVFASRPECEGGNACRDGSFGGRRLTRTTRLPRGPRVVVAGGRRGTFTAATCATFCSDAFVTWDEGAYRFRLGMKAGRLEDLRRVAAAVESR